MVLVTLVCNGQGRQDAQKGAAVHARRIVPQERREQAEYSKRAFPLGYIPAGARERALAQTRQADAAIRGPKGPGIFMWYNAGPAPITQSSYGTGGLNSGRVPAVAVDPLDPLHHWLIGTAQGGIWDTTNGGATWTPRSDDQASLSIGAITMAPSHITTIFAGTGESNFRGDDYAGAGLLVSYDSGVHWQMLNSSFGQSSLSRIQSDANNISNLVVATVRGGGGVTDAASGTNYIPTAPPRGIFVSTNGGTNFSRVLTGEATDLQANPLNFVQQYAGLGEVYGAATNGIYRTTNRWATFELINGPWTSLATPTQMGRVALAISPSSPGTLYVGIAEARVDYRADLVGIWRTDNAWANSPTWTQIPSPPVYNDYAYSPRFWYHFSMLVDPDDPGTMYLCELDVWKHTTSPASWKSVGGVTPYYKGFSSSLPIHPDNHAVSWLITQFDKRLLLGNDGGVWLSDTQVPGTWQNMNNGLATLQFYRGAVDPRPKSPLALGGTQDNGVPMNTGNQGWPFILGGDGGDCAISSTNPDTDWAYSYDVQYGDSDILRTLDSGKHSNEVATVLNPYLLPDFQQFYVHFEKSPRNDNLFIAGTDQLWRSDDFFSGMPPSWSMNGPSMTDVTGAPVPISAMAFAPSDTNGLIYAFATEDGQMLVTTNGGTSWNNLNGASLVPRRYISGLAFSPTDPNTLYVTLSGFDEGTPGQPGHLFRSANALASAPAWVNVSPPVNLPMNCLAINPNNSTNIFVGSDIGVWSTADGGGSWAHHGPSLGMPNVAVFDIRMNSAGQPTAFTHGRSVFTYELVTIPIVVLQGSFACLVCPPAPCLQCPPDERWLNPEDLVTVSFPLQNISPIDTVDLTATIVASPQITPVSGTQRYGVLVGQGAAVSRAFTFQAHLGTGPGGPLGPGACGDIIQVTLQLSDQTNDLGQVTIQVRLGRASRPLAENFDEIQSPALPPGWASVVTGVGVPWSCTTNSPYGGDTGEDRSVPSAVPNTSVFTPDPTGVSESFLLSPAFRVSTALAQLYFVQGFSVSNSYDGCILEIAIGTQPFQEITAAGGSFAQGGYNGRLNDFNPLGLRRAWTGDSGGWVPVYVNLPAGAAGQTVQLRWTFATSRGNTNGFWFMDSVQLTEPTCLPPVTNPVIINPAVQGSSFSFAINTVTSRTYIIQYKTNLLDTGWQFLQSVAGDGTQKIVNAPLNLSQAFYRFVVE